MYSNLVPNILFWFNYSLLDDMNIVEWKPCSIYEKKFFILVKETLF